MPRYKSSLIAHSPICAATSAFYFRKPEGFEFEPGQFASFTLFHPGEPDMSANTRTLSIASAPHERSLMVAMRVRPTDFKRTLCSSPIGAELLLKGPYGQMTLPKNASRPTVFLAGGIGITPFRSLIWNAAKAKSPRKILLFYSVRVPEEAAFLEELQEMERLNEHYKMVCTVTQPDKAAAPWQGEKGRLSIEMLSKWIPDLNVPIYYVAGPPAMVSGVREMLIGGGISEEDIRAEEFAGYD